MAAIYSIVTQEKSMESLLKYTRSISTSTFPPLITCDGTGLIISSAPDMGFIPSSLITSAIGLTFHDSTECLPKSGLNFKDLTIDRWRIEDLRNWNTIGSIPDLCYCVSCDIVYCSRADILSHSCSGVQKENFEELTEENCDVVEFLSWFLPQVIVYNDVEQVTHYRFNIIRRKKLIGAPKNCCFGGFMTWLLSNTWSRELVHQNHFIRKLFESPRQVIDWKLYPLSVKFSEKVAGKDVIGKYENCYDDDYDRVAYHNLKVYDSEDDIEAEIATQSDRIAFDLQIETAKNKEVAEIFSRREGIIPRETAVFILNSCHIFSLEDAEWFLKLFPKRFIKELGSRDKFRYEVVEEIWNIYGPKEDTKCLDLDDHTTYEPFSEHLFKFIPIRQQFDHCGRPLKGDPVFEVFSITIRKLDPNRKFLLIYMKSDASHDIPLIIYKLPEGKQVDIGKPLPLRVGLFRLPSPYSYVVISLTKSAAEAITWYFVHDVTNFENKTMDNRKYRADRIVLTNICLDRSQTSFATIKYRISLRTLRAELDFILLSKFDELIKIIDRYIVVTANGDVATKRYVKEYCEETPVYMHSGQKLEVDRCVFGVPTGFFLRVAVKLVYFAYSSPDDVRVIEGYQDFKMPRYDSTQGLTLSTSDASTDDRLCVECSWNGDR